MQGAFSFTENGDQITTSMKYGEDNSDKAHASGQHSEDAQTVNDKEIVSEIEENHSPILDQDPLVESIFALQSVQEALETELQKLGEIGKEAASTHVANLDGSSSVESTSGPGICEPSSSDQLSSERINRNNLSYMEAQLSTLTHTVNSFESKLKESRALLEVKELRITELEATIIGGNMLEEGLAHGTVSREERFVEVTPELENLFQVKIQAEVEYLALSGTIKKLREDLREGIELFGEQNSSVGKGSLALNKVKEMGNNAAVLKKQAEDLKTFSGGVLDTEEVLKLQKRVRNVSLNFFLQLVLLILVFWLVAFQLSPHPLVVVPT